MNIGIKVLAILGLMNAMVGGCSGGGETQPQSASSKEVLVDLTASDLDEKSNNDEIEKKIIKTGRVSFETDDLTKTRDWVAGLIKNNGGNITSDREDKYGQRSGQNLTVRVPVAKFDKLITEISSGVKKLESKEVTASDVTEEFIDVEARLGAKKALENRYLELLKQAKNLNEMLQIEKQLTDIRGEIESIEGRLKYLQNQVAYSTLDIYFYQEMPKTIYLGSKLSNGFRNGWDNLILFFVGLVNLWPFVLIGAGLIWFFVRRKRKRIASGK
jgi:hypothetical protein